MLPLSCVGIVEFVICVFTMCVGSVELAILYWHCVCGATVELAIGV